MKGTARVFDVAKAATVDTANPAAAAVWTVSASGDDLRVQWVTDTPPAKDSVVTVTIGEARGADEIERLRAENADAYNRGLEDGAALHKCKFDLPPGTWRVTVHDDGTVEVVPLVQSAAAKDAWGAEMWRDAPEQGDERA